MKKESFFSALFAVLFLLNAVYAADFMAPSSTNPGGFSASEVPQLIVVGSDDNTSAEGLRWMVGELASRTNFDGSAMRASFYSNTNSWNNNSDLVLAHQEAYAAKHEVGNHTKDHPYCIQWSSDNTTILKTWTIDELENDQILSVKNALITQIGVATSDLYGFRTPFLGFSDSVFTAMQNAGIIYDCSIGEGGSCGNYYWPYTLDTKNYNNDNYAPGLPNWWTGTQNGGNVTIHKHSGLWELPVYNYMAPYDVTEFMKTLKTWADGAIGGLDYNMWAKSNSGGWELNKDQSIRTLKNTLDLMYDGNRTPFTIGAHSQMYLGTEPDFPNIQSEADRKAVFTEFLDYANEFDNVWFVSGAQAINYCKRPVRASEFDPDDYLPENFNSTGTKYTLTVENGIGDGDYTEGAIKTISADDAPSGKQFDKWTGDIATVADVNASTTTITIGTENLTVTANYKDATGPDTLNPSINFTTYDASDSGWQVGSIDNLNSSVSVTKPSDAVVKGDFNFVPYDEALGDTGYAYGSIAYYDNLNFKDVNYIKVTYKSSAAVSISLEQTSFTEGGAHCKKLAKSDGFTTVLIEVNGTNFTQPSWWLDENTAVDLDMEKMNGVSFEPVVPDEGGEITLEISELIFYGYDDGTPITSISNNSVSQMAINHVTSRSMNISIPENGKYSLSLYSLDGKLITKIADKDFSRGTLNVSWNGSNLSSQMYLISLKGANTQSVKKAFIK